MQHHMATRALDGGALGIVMPHVDTPEQARDIADHLKYPPIGHRSVAGGQANFDFKPMTIAELIAELNAATLVTVMLETPTAIANAEAIAAVPGDRLPADRDQRSGGGDGHSRRIRPRAHRRRLQTTVAACRKHGKWAGIGGVYTEDLLRKYVGMGVQMVLAGNDVGFLMAAGTQRAAQVREWGGK